jgi:uncharacterized membrane protein YagU involved in acid resistance
MGRVVGKSLLSGTIAALAMMPFGFAFRAMGLRVGYYGPKFASLLTADPSPLFLFTQHMVIGWLSALPLILIIAQTRLSPVVTGILYGVAYYVAVNSLALPLYFGDPTPWNLGWAVIFPSLVVHVVFGGCVGFLASRMI